MKLTTHRPSAPLAPFVDAIWSVDGTAAHAGEVVLPNGAVELILNLGAPHQVIDSGKATLYREAWIAGIQERPIQIAPVAETRLIGVRFRPGGCFPFLRVPQHELTNRVVESDAIFGNVLVDLRDCVGASGSHAERLAIVGQTLLRMIQPERRDAVVERALSEIGRTSGRVRIAALARSAGLTQKSLISRFRRSVGTTPKTLARIERLQSVIRCTNRSGGIDWSDVALACGYYDQAHLIREFRKLAGVTPEQYARRRDEDENHLVVR